MPFRRGVDAINRAIEKGAQTGGGFTDSGWFKWKPNERKILRFLTDYPDLYEVVMHENVTCKDGKKRSMICRKDHPTDGVEVCELCDLAERMKDDDGKYTEARPRSVIWGIAVERVEKRDEQGRLQGYGDLIVDQKGRDGEPVMGEDGKPKRQPVVAMLRQGTQNFWATFRAYYERYGTLRDRDYEVQRRGERLDTEYVSVPCDPLAIENLDERYADFLPKIEDVLARMSSTTYYDKWLRGVEPEKGSGEQARSQGGSAPASEEIPSDAEEYDRLQRARDELKAGARSGEYSE